MAPISSTNTGISPLGRATVSAGRCTPLIRPTSRVAPDSTAPVLPATPSVCTARVRPPRPDFWPDWQQPQPSTATTQSSNSVNQTAKYSRPNGWLYLFAIGRKNKESHKKLRRPERSVAESKDPPRQRNAVRIPTTPRRTNPPICFSDKAYRGIFTG